MTSESICPYTLRSIAESSGLARMAGKKEYPRTYLDHNLLGTQRRPITDSYDVTGLKHSHVDNQSE
jgi:hypothetical protein